MNTNRVTIGAATVVLLVMLRLALGCHFLYEGVWKIKNADKFSAEPFLSEAKGPLSPLFYAMLDDLDGRKRLCAEKDPDDQWALGVATDENGKALKGAKGRPVYKVESNRLTAWAGLKEKVAEQRGLSDAQKLKADDLLTKYTKSLEKYFDDHGETMSAYLGSLSRFQKEQAAGNQGAAHQIEGAWKRERALRREVAGWFTEIDGLERDYREGLWNLLTDEQRAMGPLQSKWNPLRWTRVEQINFAVTFALTAIGLCLMVGFFTRLAALGGGMFMAFVVATQPAWPGSYPADPPVVGHALLINKDFVEMLALFLIATTAVGRWGGLDYLIHNLIVRPFLGKRMNREQQEG